jgi:hypothetical protein
VGKKVVFATTVGFMELRRAQELPKNLGKSLSRRARAAEGGHARPRSDIHELL